VRQLSALANLEPVSRTFIEISLFPNTSCAQRFFTDLIIQTRLRREFAQFQVASNASNDSSFYGNMLVLPTGQILFHK